MISAPQSLATPSIEDTSEALFSQLMNVMGFQHPNPVTRSLRPFFHTPIQRMSRLLVELNLNIARDGWNPAVNHFSHQLVSTLVLHGEKTIPAQGPLMVICNHPAAYDVAILAAAIPRNDLKILTSDIPIIQMFPEIADHCIPVYYDISRRVQTIRSAIVHLDNDGAILLFPRGNVEPDPQVSPGAEASLEGWSASIELFLRQVPKTLTVVAIASGMLSEGWFKNPIINCWRKYEQRQKVAEIFQIASQLLLGKSPRATPVVRFASPLSISELGGVNAQKGTLLANLKAHARSLLKEHLSI
jgi:hypothetical protein